MSHIIDAILSRDDVERHEPAQSDDIDLLLERYKTALPDELVQLWLASDGLGLPTLDARIPTTTDIIKWTQTDEGSDYLLNNALLDRGFVPIFDDYQSNYLMVNVRPPLAFRVSHVPHDDGSRLLYRDCDSAFIAVSALLEQSEANDASSFFYETSGDYAADTTRSVADQSAAKKLLSTFNSNEQWNYAIQLLDASNLNEWALVLETDHFVRRDAIHRMRQMSSPDIRNLLERDQCAYRAFMAEMAQVAHAVGLSVEEGESDTLRVGQSWLNGEAFFHRRNMPGAQAKLKQWMQDRADGLNPNDRDGNFLES